MPKEKLREYTNGEVKQIITKEYEGRYFNDYVEVICFCRNSLLLLCPEI